MQKREKAFRVQICGISTTLTGRIAESSQLQVWIIIENIILEIFRNGVIIFNDLFRSGRIDIKATFRTFLIPLLAGGRF